jgi:hypothetical protein
MYVDTFGTRWSHARMSGSTVISMRRRRISGGRGGRPLTIATLRPRIRPCGGARDPGRYARAHGWRASQWLSRAVLWRLHGPRSDRTVRGCAGGHRGRTGARAVGSVGCTAGSWSRYVRGGC